MIKQFHISFRWQIDKNYDWNLNFQSSPNQTNEMVHIEFKWKFNCEYVKLVHASFYQLIGICLNWRGRGCYQEFINLFGDFQKTILNFQKTLWKFRKKIKNSENKKIRKKINFQKMQIQEKKLKFQEIFWKFQEWTEIRKNLFSSYPNEIFWKAFRIWGAF